MNISHTIALAKSRQAGRSLRPQLIPEREVKPNSWMNCFIVIWSADVVKYSQWSPSLSTHVLRNPHAEAKCQWSKPDPRSPCRMIGDLSDNTLETVLEPSISTVSTFIHRKDSLGAHTWQFHHAWPYEQHQPWSCIGDAWQHAHQAGSCRRRNPFRKYQFQGRT